MNDKKREEKKRKDKNQVATKNFTTKIFFCFLLFVSPSKFFLLRLYFLLKKQTFLITHHNPVWKYFSFTFHTFFFPLW